MERTGLPCTKKLKKSDPDPEVKLRDYMCEKFYDIRTFGAVMTTFVKASLNCGQTDPGGRCSLAVPGAWTRLWGRWLRSPGRSLPRSGTRKTKIWKWAGRALYLMPVPGGGLRFRKPCPEDHRVFRGGSGAFVGGHSPYVLQRSFHDQGEDGDPGADCVQTQQGTGGLPGVPAI